jgi:hypothetical protein
MPPIITITNQGTIASDPQQRINDAFATSPNIAVKMDLTAQAGDILSGSLYSVPVNLAGLYRVSVYAVVTRAASSSSTMPAVVVGWTDNDSGVVENATVGAAITANTAGANLSGVFLLSAKAGSNITVAQTGYLSTGVVSMQFALRVRLVYLG